MRPSRDVVALALVLVLGALDLAEPGPAEADLFVVTKTSDTADGVCSVSDCSLREAVIAANAAAGDDTISVPAGTYVLTRPGPFDDTAATGDLDLLDAVRIEGAGAGATVIDGGALDRVLHVDPAFGGASAIVTDLTLRGGVANTGGAVTVEVLGVLTLARCVLRGNRSDGSGGAVRNAGQLDVFACWFEDDATGAGGDGGAIASEGPLSVRFSSFTRNRGAFGGAVRSIGGSLTTAETTFAENEATGTGGAIYVQDGSVSLSSVTLHGNRASFGGSALAVSGTTADVQGSLLVGTCSATTGGGFSSRGGNLESPGATCGLLDPSDQPGVADARLAPLGDWGGTTPALVPIPDGPAIDRGGTGCSSTDQRLLARPVDRDGDGEPECDVGATELQAGEQPLVFEDGFEDGDYERWTGHLP